VKPRQGRARPARRAWLIVCEGANTEPIYLESLVRALGLATTVDVEIHGAPGGTDPETLVNFAVRRSAERAREVRRDITKATYEEVWVVLDTEGRDHARAAALPGALQKALARGVKIAVSRPCFEVWYILHDRATPPGLSVCDDARPVLRKLLGAAYDKSRSDAQRVVAWALPRTAAALEHGGRQSCFAADANGRAANLPSSTGSGVHRLVAELVAMSADLLARRRLGFVVAG